MSDDSSATVLNQDGYVNMYKRVLKVYIVHPYCNGVSVRQYSIEDTTVFNMS